LAVAEEVAVLKAFMAAATGLAAVVVLVDTALLLGYLLLLVQHIQ
jgi:hypothetical protein